MTVALAQEMIDANESAIALDIVSDVLVEVRASIAPEAFAEFNQLAEALGLGPETAARLRPFVSA